MSKSFIDVGDEISSFWDGCKRTVKALQGADDTVSLLCDSDDDEEYEEDTEEVDDDLEDDESEPW